MLPGPRSAAGRSANLDGRCAGSAILWWITAPMYEGPNKSGGLIARGRLAQRQCHRSCNRREIEDLAEQPLVLVEQDRTVPTVVVLDVSDVGTVVGVVRHRNTGRRKGDHTAQNNARQGPNWTAAIHRMQDRQASAPCQPLLGLPNRCLCPIFRDSI